jgi:hypothetical protein
MWTNNGCRGEFKCNGVDHVSCDVMEGGKHVCNCAAKPTGPVTCKGWISDLQKKILLNKEVVSSICVRACFELRPESADVPESVSELI